LKALNIKINPSIFSFLSAYKNYKPLNFKNKLKFLEISRKNITHIPVLASIYKNIEFFVFKDIKDLDFIKEFSLENVKVINKEDIKNEQFDILSLNDDFSAFDIERQEELETVLKNNTKNGSYLFFKFSSLPEKAPLNVFNRFLWEVAGNDQEKFEELTVAFSKRPSKFLIENKSLFRLLNQFIENKEYQEFFNPNFSAKYFHEIYDYLDSLDFNFIGRLDLEKNCPEISLFPSHIPTVAKFDREREREEIIDFVLNVGKHEDVWIKNGTKGEFYDFIDENFFLLPRQSVENIRKILLLPGGHRYPLTAPIFQAFFDKGDNPIRLSDHPDFRGNKESITKAYFKLAASGEFFICSFEDDLIPLSKIENKLPEKFTISEANEFLLRLSIDNLKDSVLVSKVTGGASILLTPLETIILFNAYKFGTSKAVEETEKFLKSKGNKKILIFGEVKSAKEVTREDVERAAKNVLKGRKALNLQRLGVVRGV